MTRVWRDEVEKIGSTSVGNFKKLFSTSNPEIKEELINAIHRKVSDQTNFLLTRDFQVGEVERALKQMFPTTAPGPDGMPPLFYQKFWPTVSAVVSKTVLDFLNLGITPLNFSETHIVLIPKVKNPKLVTEYHPISLCNVAYKITSKTIVNRLKQVLPTLVCENQSAFVAE